MRARFIPIVTVTLTLLLTGCSGGSGSEGTSQTGAATSASPTSSAVPSVDELVAQVRASIDGATSVRLHGSLTENGSTTTIEVLGTRDGSNQSATISQDGASATILTVDGRAYLRADQAFLDAQGLGVTSQGDKYLTSDAVTAAIGSRFNVGSLLDSLTSGELNTDAMDPVTIVDVDGRSAYLLNDRTAGSENQIYVAADGSAQLLKAEGQVDGAPLTLTFSDWNAVPPVTAPPADQVVTV